jgi:hypothetical protein
MPTVAASPTRSSANAHEPASGWPAPVVLPGRSVTVPARARALARSRGLVARPSPGRRVALPVRALAAAAAGA